MSDNLEFKKLEKELEEKNTEYSNIQQSVIQSKEMSFSINDTEEELTKKVNECIQENPSVGIIKNSSLLHCFGGADLIIYIDKTPLGNVNASIVNSDWETGESFIIFDCILFANKDFLLPSKDFTITFQYGNEYGETLEEIYYKCSIIKQKSIRSVNCAAFEDRYFIKSNDFKRNIK